MIKAKIYRWCVIPDAKSFRVKTTPKNTGFLKPVFVACVLQQGHKYQTTNVTISSVSQSTIRILLNIAKLHKVVVWVV